MCLGLACNFALKLIILNFNKISKTHRVTQSGMKATPITMWPSYLTVLHHG